VIAGWQARLYSPVQEILSKRGIQIGLRGGVGGRASTGVTGPLMRRRWSFSGGSDTREGDTFALSEPLPEYEFDQRLSG